MIELKILLFCQDRKLVPVVVGGGGGGGGGGGRGGMGEQPLARKKCKHPFLTQLFQKQLSRFFLILC